MRERRARKLKNVVTFFALDGYAGIRGFFSYKADDYRLEQIEASRSAPSASSRQNLFLCRATFLPRIRFPCPGRRTANSADRDRPAIQTTV